jgi:hypothetical protein
MRDSSGAILVAAAMAAAAACVQSGEPKAAAATAAAPAAVRSSEVADRATPAERGKSTAVDRDVCALLPAAEVTEVTGLPIARVARVPNGCEWYPNAAAQQQRSADTARATLQKLMTQEPKSAEDGVHSMETILNGARGAAGPDKPVFVVTIQWTDGDQAEMLLKGTVAVNGGRVENIEGLGDHAFALPMGVAFYVRKGSALISFAGIGARERTIALARRIVPRIQ